MAGLVAAQEMIKRQPYLPRFMAGGETNPLGARAMYLGNTEYRIHGTNQPSTIGTFVSSGCIRLTNEDVEDLYSRVTVGTTVVVLPGANTAASQLHRKYWRLEPSGRLAAPISRKISRSRIFARLSQSRTSMPQPETTSDNTHYRKQPNGHWSRIWAKLMSAFGSKADTESRHAPMFLQ